ncbi:SET and MYND domain-containing protein 4-like [Toxorhynchites rutilus septentrionalis]|uniref:SET and MYND domain-containing protein 4-like n=1 Tax=Toxorhynchites rutilus septentrionalis TaxID=329112 RepID=UPI0024784318|nr:SET and MYND domain-containing protein 4-like [Toxorhynchites rutilus septentrionalis]
MFTDIEDFFDAPHIRDFVLERAFHGIRLDESPEIFRANSQIVHKQNKKCNIRATQARQLGNRLYSESLLIRAAERYNESLAWAEPESEAMTLAYGNRSAVSYELQEYQRCLDDIERARKNGKVNPQLEARLNNRKIASQAALEKKINDPDSSFPRPMILRYPSNPKIPQMAQCLEFQKSSKYGRHIKTNQDLHVGDVIMIDKPFVSTLFSRLKYQRCTYCQSDSLLYLMPCLECTDAMFCTVDCRERAFNEYHRFECSVLGEMRELIMEDTVLFLALRILLKGISAFNDDLDNLVKQTKEVSKKPLYIFNQNWNGINTQKCFLAIQTLICHEDDMKEHNYAASYNSVHLILEQLLRYTPLKDICKNDEHKEILCDLFLRHLLIILYNTGTVTKLKDFQPSVNSFSYIPSNLSLSVYPLYSLINYSCVPNVTTIHLPDGRVGIVVSQAIKRGGQLFTTNDLTFENHPRLLRQGVCRLVLNYECTCVACQQNYPLAVKLKLIPQLSATCAVLSIPENKGFDAPFALEKLPKICEFLEKNDKHFPCLELIEAREHLRYCLLQIYTADPITKKVAKITNVRFNT